MGAFDGLSESSKPLYIEASHGSISVSIESKGEGLPPASIEASFDEGETWAPFPIDGTQYMVQSGSRVYFRAGSAEGNTDGISSGDESYRRFVIEGPYCAAGGNIMSLLSRSFDGMSSIPSEYCFASLFSDCDTMTDAPEIGASVLSENCFSYMFSGCSSLVSAPDLSGISELAESCFEYMFEDCTALPSLPMMPLASVAMKASCYEGMFSGCI